jgi:fucose 4-O-acetylase-like acetyltransferase
MHVSFPGEWVLQRLLGLAAGVGLACLLSKVWPLEWLGSRTLQVYLAHTGFIVLIVVGLHFLGVSGSTWAASVAPFAVTLAVVALSLGLHRIVSGGPLRYLYQRPRAGERVRAS